MENASKALIIAGGVLVSILIISILVYAWINISNFHASIEDSKKSEKILEFNNQYESYNKQLLRGADVASVINKVRDNNSKIEIRDGNGNITGYSDDKELLITCEIKLKNKVNGPHELKPNTYTQGSKEITEMLTNSAYDNDLKEFKRLYFKCIKIEYNETNGRVKKISFEQIPSSEIESLFNN